MPMGSPPNFQKSRWGETLWLWSESCASYTLRQCQDIEFSGLMLIIIFLGSFLVAFSD